MADYIRYLPFNQKWAIFSYSKVFKGHIAVAMFDTEKEAIGNIGIWFK